MLPRKRLGGNVSFICCLIPSLIHKESNGKMWVIDSLRTYLHSHVLVHLPYNKHLITAEKNCTGLATSAAPFGHSERFASLLRKHSSNCGGVPFLHLDRIILARAREANALA